MSPFVSSFTCAFVIYARRRRCFRHHHHHHQSVAILPQAGHALSLVKLRPFEEMQVPQSVGLAFQEHPREAIGNKMLLDHSSQWPQRKTPLWIKVRDDGYDYCLLCHKVATEAHLGSAPHEKNLWWFGVLGTKYRRDWPGAGPVASAENAAAGASDTAGWCPQASPLVPQVPSELGNSAFYVWDPKHLKFWCNLCGKYGSDSHVASASHRNRAEWPTSYGFNVPHPAIASQPQQQSPPPPQPPLERRVTEWQAHWDAKSGRHSFICARTGERRFHMPERVPYFEIF